MNLILSVRHKPTLITLGDYDMILESLDLIAITIALSTSIVVITMSVRQNMLLQRENMNLRRLLRKEREKNVTRF
jgi:hypothetical protein